VDALSAGRRRGGGGEFLSARLGERDGPGQLRTRLDLSGGLEPVEGLTVTGAVSGSRWHRFDGWTVEAGAAYRPDLGLDVEVGVGGALGVRGAPRPLADRADSVTFRQGQARASAAWGPLSATVRGIYQDVSRQLPFGGSFDPGLPEAGPGVRVGGVEGTLQAPLLPLGWLLGAEVEPIRLSGTWRHQEILDGPDPGSGGEDGSSDDPRVLYLPTDQARVSAFFHDSFFQGDLRVQAEVAVRHRSPMATVDPAGGAGEVAGWTTVDWNLMLNLKDVRIWWRVDNTRSAPWEDMVGLARPATRNVFGVKWEFFN
jgi:hypothetical protein